MERNYIDWVIPQMKFLVPMRGYMDELWAAIPAIFLGEVTGATVTVLNVQKTADKGKYNFEDVFKQILNIAKRLHIPTNRINKEVVKGTSARVEILKHISDHKENPYDLVILGTQRTQGFPADFRSSNAVNLAMQCDRPPLMVIQSPTKKTKASAFNIPPLETILFPFAKGDHLDDFVVKLASLFMSSAGVGKRKILALKVIKVPNLMPPSSAREFLVEIEEKFLKGLGKYSILGLPISPRIVVGHSWSKTVAYMIKQEKPTWAIIGIRGSFMNISRKSNPIWRISKSAKIPIAFIFMPDEVPAQEGLYK